MIRSKADVASLPLCAARPFQSISAPGAHIALGGRAVTMEQIRLT